MSIEVREIAQSDKKGRRHFLDVVDTIYAGDPHYVRPLDMDVSDRLDHKKNPFYEHAEGTTFVAYDGGKPVGRISAQLDKLHLERHKDETGFFGFFDTIDDENVAAALLSEAAKWNRAKGLKAMRGPMSMNINEEVGVLVEGFDTPPMIMMPHHRPYQGGLAEKAGYSKCKDLYAWSYEIGTVPTRAQRGRDEIAALPEVTGRPVNPKRVLEDVKIIMDIFNDAWADNWGFVPLTENELTKLAADTSLVLMPEITRIMSIDGEPAAVALALPNVNEMIGDLRGSLFPTGLLKLLWRLKVRGPQSGRLIILGIRKKWRHVRKYAGLSAFLYVEMNKAGHLLGLKRGELGWTLEDNAAINAGIRLMGGRIYKRYRVYERAL